MTENQDVKHSQVMCDPEVVLVFPLDHFQDRVHLAVGHSNHRNLANDIHPDDLFHPANLVFETNNTLNSQSNIDHESILCRLPFRFAVFYLDPEMGLNAPVLV